MLKLARLYLFSPSKGAQAARRPENLGRSLGLYAVFLAAYVLFFWLKPFDFPEQNAAFPLEASSLGYWLKVAVWQPPLEAAWVVLLGGLVVWFRGGALPVRVAVGAAWWAALLGLVVAYSQLHGISKAQLAAGVAVLYGLFYPLLRRFPKEDWGPLFAFMLGINVIGLVLFLPMAAAVGLGLPKLFYGAQIAGGLWVLGAGTLGLRELSGLRLPRAFMAIILAMFFQLCLPFALYLLGLVPQEILKALFYG